MKLLIIFSIILIIFCKKRTSAISSKFEGTKVNHCFKLSNIPFICPYKQVVFISDVLLGTADDVHCNTFSSVCDVNIWPKFIDECHGKRSCQLLIDHNDYTHNCPEETNMISIVHSCILEFDIFEKSICDTVSTLRNYAFINVYSSAQSNKNQLMNVSQHIKGKSCACTVLSNIKGTYIHYRIRKIPNENEYKKNNLTKFKDVIMATPFGTDSIHNCGENWVHRGNLNIINASLPWQYHYRTCKLNTIKDSDMNIKQNFNFFNENSQLNNPNLYIEIFGISRGRMQPLHIDCHSNYIKENKITTIQMCKLTDYIMSDRGYLMFDTSMQEGSTNLTHGSECRCNIEADGADKIYIKAIKSCILRPKNIKFARKSENITIEKSSHELNQSTWYQHLELTYRNKSKKGIDINLCNIGSSLIVKYNSVNITFTYNENKEDKILYKYSAENEKKEDIPVNIACYVDYAEKKNTNFSSKGDYPARKNFLSVFKSSRYYGMAITILTIIVITFVISIFAFLIWIFYKHVQKKKRNHVTGCHNIDRYCTCNNINTLGKHSISSNISEYRHIFDTKPVDEMNPSTQLMEDYVLSIFNESKNTKINPLNTLLNKTPKLDNDARNGIIDFEEFVLLMMKHNTSIESRENLKEAFRLFDVNNNGYLTIEELYEMMTNRGEKLTDDEFTEMIQEIDIDNDGHIEFDEIVKTYIGEDYGDVED
ncbi:hypothetical protein A3Q56_05729 [Intoshia linei]|uniref:EF-hand domain-containing protein n=1 Tax=Intoshia linei TaxID=1819745 RepID=A0A177AZD3_9BILA|nr:hypothetical protein A3Q56_05729 [Intoshia linei]